MENMKDKYGELGRLFATVDAVPRFLEEPGVCDVVYQIDEDKVYTYRRIEAEFQGDTPRTKRTVVLNRVLTRPGELANANDIEKSKRRLGGTGFFERAGPQGPQVKLVRVGEEHAPSLRGQSDDSAPPSPFGIPSVTRRSSAPQIPRSPSPISLCPIGANWSRRKTGPSFPT